jgi:predicted phosphate transport protein (TIGR00153 family)
MRLLPREEKFFALFTRQVEIISQAAELLLDGVKAGNPRLAAVAHEIINLEHQGDEVIHEIFTRLNQTFITPLDPEDIHSLSSKLDDVLDGIEDAVHRMVAYKLDPVPTTVVSLCDIIYRCCRSLQQAVENLEKDKKEMDSCVIEINRLENEADTIVRSTVADLLNNEPNAIIVIKLKEIYEFLEATTDRCEDVADVLQNVVVKNS